MRDIISLRELSKEDILSILERAKELEESPEPKLLENKILSLLFFEPSTRTKLSFQAAMQRLGGTCLSVEDNGTTSLSKGESISDTIKITGLYSDAMVVRSPYEGAARLASEVLEKPVINAGDGANQHPTQTLLDLYTIQKEKGCIDGLKIAFVGDLKYGRTVHSLAKALNMFDCELYFIAPDALQIPEYILGDLDIDYHIMNEFDPVLDQLDIFYMTRIQRERFDIQEEYEQYKGVYRIDRSIIDKCKKDMKIMHPLPRVDEIHYDLDKTENAVYFSQAENGVYVREALLAMLLSEGYGKEIKYDELGGVCKNPKCISHHEGRGTKWVNEADGKRCFYCEKRG